MSGRWDAAPLQGLMLSPPITAQAILFNDPSAPLLLLPHLVQDAQQQGAERTDGLRAVELVHAQPVRRVSATMHTRSLAGSAKATLGTAASAQGRKAGLTPGRRRRPDRVTPHPPTYCGNRSWSQPMGWRKLKYVTGIIERVHVGTTCAHAAHVLA